MSWELGGQLLVRTAKGQHLEPYPGRPQLFPLDQRLGGKLLGLPQELEGLDLLQELQILGLAALEEESQNLGAAEYQDHSICSQAS